MRWIRSLLDRCQCPIQSRDRSALHWITMKGHTRLYTLKDGTEQYAAVFYTGKRFGRDGKIRDAYRWIRGFRTEDDADRELRKMLTAIDNETYVQPSKQNLAD